MTTAAEPKSSIGGFWWLAALPLLYVLSIGPVLKVVQSSGPNPAKRSVLRQVYAPVVWLHDHTFLEKPIEAYCGLWGVK